jgi:hypothetical protein
MIRAIFFHLAVAVTSVLAAITEVDSIEGGHLLKQFSADGKDYTVHAFGQLVNAPLVAPPILEGVYSFPLVALHPS